MLELLNRNAASIQAIGSVLAIFVAIVIPWWQTHVSRCDQAAARRRAARVLAMELLPTVKAMHADLARALQMGWNDPNHIDAHVLQERRIGAPEVLEGALNRLAVLDEETIRPILGMLSGIREYHRLQSVTDIRQVIELELAGELAQRRNFLDDACRHAGEAVRRLDAIAIWKVSPHPRA